MTNHPTTFALFFGNRGFFPASLIASANGTRLWNNTGGGSGGSVWITAGTLAGSGSVQANGSYSNYAGGGAGGRIALYYDTSSLTLDASHLQAYGSSGYVYGGPGTVYLRQEGGDARGTLLVDNNGHCASGARSAMAEKLLRQQGFEQVFNAGSWASIPD